MSRGDWSHGSDMGFVGSGDSLASLNDHLNGC